MTVFYRYLGDNRLKPVNGGNLLTLEEGGPVDPPPTPIILHGVDLPRKSDEAEKIIGAQGTLVEYTGDTVFTAAFGPVVIENSLFTEKNIRVRSGANVTLRNCKIIGPLDSTSYTVRINEGGNARLLLENCTVVCRSRNGGQNAVTGWGETSLAMRRTVVRGGIDQVHFHGKGPAIWATGDPLVPMATFLMDECWIGDNERLPGSHSDLFQAAGTRPNTITNYVFRRTSFMGYSIPQGADPLTTRANPDGVGGYASAGWINSTGSEETGSGGTYFAIRDNYFEGGNYAVDGGTGAAPSAITGNLFSPKLNFGATVRVGGWENFDNRWAASGVLTNGREVVKGQLIDGSLPHPEPEEPTDPTTALPPGSWSTAVQSRDITQIVSWYEQHTGFDGVNPFDPSDAPLTQEDLEWVSGGIKSEFDGQIIEGKWSNHIRISHSNVTIRRCRVTDGTTYGAYFNPTFGSQHKNILIEFVTFDSPAGSDTNSILFRTGNTTDHVATIRFCDTHGFAAGFRLQNKIHAEYNYFHDLAHPPNVHSNCIRMMDSGSTALRNLGTDGTSNVFAWYIADNHSHVSNSKYVENIAGGTVEMPDGRIISPIASPSYAFSAAGNYAPVSVNLVIVGNFLYEGLQYGPFTGGSGPTSVRWGEDGNYRYDNVWLTTGLPAFTENRP